MPERSLHSPSKRNIRGGIPWSGLGILTALALVMEGARWGREGVQALHPWLAGRNADWLPFLPWLLLAPVFWYGLQRRPRLRPKTSPVTPSGKPSAKQQRLTSPDLEVSTSKDIRWRDLLIAGGMFLLGFATSRFVGREFTGLPPAYHDEYSYLFQAQTFLAGRWSFPSFEPWPELFNQMHVLNEGRFASRYFPGTGLWMVPWVALGDPWLGHQLAQAICTMLVFWIGRELAGISVGIVAGLLFAVSPGLLIFSNLLLSHLPALVGLLSFLWAFLLWQRKRHPGWCFIAGCGLAWAMLCRPMTAAGFGFPFGVVFVVWWLRGTALFEEDALPVSHHQRSSRRFLRRSVSAASMAAPLLLGLGVLLWSHVRITGSLWTSPYQQYTDIYTPRHVYGFNNRLRGERSQSPKVLENYDQWAENLTPKLAAENVLVRTESSLRWSLGIVPLLLGGWCVLLSPRLGDRRWLLIWWTIVSLHVAHIPYWYAGIMNWHYVFETAPLWILIFAEGTRRLVGTWRRRGRGSRIVWWSGLVVIALAVNFVTVPHVWPGRLEQAETELLFPKTRYAAFRQQIEELRNGQPALVILRPDETDRHIDYVSNPPSLEGPVLVARLHDLSRWQAVAALFPQRKVLIFDAATRQFLPPSSLEPSPE